MTTRELTSEERSALDTLWAQYLDGMEALRIAVNHNQTRNPFPAANELWRKYTEGYAGLGIIVTLAGYRAKV